MLKTIVQNADMHFNRYGLTSRFSEDEVNLPP